MHGNDRGTASRILDYQSVFKRLAQPKFNTSGDFSCNS